MKRSDSGSRVERFQRAAHHVGIQVTSRAGVDLHRTRARSLDALGVEQRFLIAFDDRHRPMAHEVADGALEKGRLARAGRAGEVEREDVAFGQPLAVLLGEEIVLRQHLLFQRDRLGVNVAVVVVVMSWSW